MKYRVKYAAEGLLSGKQVGDQVAFDSADTDHLLALGLIETEDEYEARQAARTEAEAESEDATAPAQDAQVQALTDENAKLADENTALFDENAKLKGELAQAKAKGKELKDEIKATHAAMKTAQGERDAALAELAKREAANVESGQPADGQ